MKAPDNTRTGQKKSANPSKRPAPEPEIVNPLFQEARLLRAKRRFAQHFLIDQGVIDNIVEAVSPKAEETVLEIGPGCGFLTRALLNTPGKLLAVESDRDMAAYLRYKLNVPNNKAFTLVEEDILRFNFDNTLPPTFKVVGNLPYNMATPIILHLVGELSQAIHPLRNRITSFTLMVQKEVGERLCAQPGVKAYNAFSITVQQWFEANLLFTVPSKAFYPAPKVESAVIRLTPRNKPLAEVSDYKLFARIVKASFAQRRKTLKNNLLASSLFVDEPACMALLAAVEQHHTLPANSLAGLRAEAVAIETFATLARLAPAYLRG